MIFACLNTISVVEAAHGMKISMMWQYATDHPGVTIMGHADVYHQRKQPAENVFVLELEAIMMAEDQF